MTMQNKFTLLSFGLVFVSLVLSWVGSIMFGGFKIGRLARQVELAVDRNQTAAFLDRFHRRLAELGFKAGAATGQFLQGGAEFGNMSSFTHAKTKKQLEIAVDDSSGAEVRMLLTLQFLDPIIGDTGESAYRDAVLDYVSGQSDAMKIVSNRSFAAFSSLVGGIWAWVALGGMLAFNVEPLVGPILVLGVTDVIIGILAIVTIKTKPGELTGIWLAIAGIVTSGSAIVGAFVLEFLKHF
jgi:hypothetical protein